MRKILITGGAGFIGSALAEKLIKNKDNFVIVVDNLLTGHLGKLPELPRENWKFIKCDVNHYRDIAEIMIAYKFDYVFHYAAVVGVQRTQENPIRVLKDIDGIENILTLAKNTGVHRIFFSSSSEIYGEPVEIPQNEYTTPLNSRLPYAVVKNVGEAFCRSYLKEYDLNYTIFRFFNTYGPKQSNDFVISRFILSALKGEKMTVFGDGSQTRTFCYIDDNIETVVKILDKNLVLNDVINIGGHNEIHILDLAKMVIGLTHSKSKIVHLPPLKEGDMTRRLPDNNQMLKILEEAYCRLKKGFIAFLKRDCLKRICKIAYEAFTTAG